MTTTNSTQATLSLDDTGNDWYHVVREDRVRDGCREVVYSGSDRAFCELLIKAVNSYASRAPVAVPQVDWQPAETAPKETEILMAWEDGHLQIVYLKNEPSFWFENEPTHWALLPAGPNVAPVASNVAAPVNDAIGVNLLRQLVSGKNSLRTLQVFPCNQAEHESVDCTCFWEQCEAWAKRDAENQSLTCADCGKQRSLSTLASRETFVCRYCLSTNAAAPAPVAPSSDVQSFVSMIARMTKDGEGGFEANAIDSFATLESLITKARELGIEKHVTQ